MDEIWYRKLTLKVKFWHFLTTSHYSNSPNLVISFEYSWFLAKNLVNFLSLPWKLHNWKCHIDAGFQFIDVIFTLSNTNSKWKPGPTFRFPVVILHPTPNLYPGWKLRHPLINITPLIHTSFTYSKLDMDEICGLKFYLLYVHTSQEIFF